jgi:hypothetical protein
MGRLQEAFVLPLGLINTWKKKPDRRVNLVFEVFP